MFSLIITIVSIALVVALVAATMFHGGDTLTHGRAAATAAGLVSGAEQISSAFKINSALNNADFIRLSDLVDSGLLKSLPEAFSDPNLNMVTTSSPSDGTASFPYLRAVDASVTAEVCQELDKLAGRAPTATAALPGPSAYTQFHEYGCIRRPTGIFVFYYKL